jgi:hypothetical protein
MSVDEPTQAHNLLEVRAVREGRRRVDGQAIARRPPLAQRVEVLEREPESTSSATGGLVSIYHGRDSEGGRVATVAGVKSPALFAGVGWRAVILLVAAMLAGLVFWFGAALPYLILDEAHLSQYATRRASIFIHIAAGTVALFAGPIQLWLGLSNRRIDVHRRLGMVYLVAGIFSSAAAFYLAPHTDGGWMFGSGLFGLGVAWFITTGMAYVSVRKSLLDQHKEWMIRSYVVMFAFVTFRVLFVALQTANIGTVQEQLGVASWFCWAVPLLITEAVLQGRKVFAAA